MRIPRAIQASAVAAVLLLSPAAEARAFRAFVSHVSDGDSLWVRTGAVAAPRAVRLQGIDAPEICQSFGAEARDALSGLALHREVVVVARARDRYERTVARVLVGSTDLAAWMVAHGWAWSDGYRGHAGRYARQQEQARQARLGLWSGAAPLHPREFRRRQGSCR